MEERHNACRPQACRQTPRQALLTEKTEKRPSQDPTPKNNEKEKDYQIEKKKEMTPSFLLSNSRILAASGGKFIKINQKKIGHRL